jgi:hypothetical protein
VVFAEEFGKLLVFFIGCRFFFVGGLEGGFVAPCLVVVGRDGVVVVSLVRAGLADQSHARPHLVHSVSLQGTLA